MVWNPVQCLCVRPLSSLLTKFRSNPGFSWVKPHTNLFLLSNPLVWYTILPILYTTTSQLCEFVSWLIFTRNPGSPRPNYGLFPKIHLFEPVSLILHTTDFVNHNVVNLWFCVTSKLTHNLASSRQNSDQCPTIQGSSHIPFSFSPGLLVWYHPLSSPSKFITPKQHHYHTLLHQKSHFSDLDLLSYLSTTKFLTSSIRRVCEARRVLLLNILWTNNFLTSLQKISVIAMRSHQRHRWVSICEDRILIANHLFYQWRRGDNNAELGTKAEL